MSTPVPEEAVVLRVGYDVSGVALFLDALEILPEEIERISQAIAATPIGNTGIFAQRGREMARAFIGGMQAELAGYQVADMAALVASRVGGGALPGSQRLAELTSQLRTLGDLKDRLQRQNEPLAIEPNFSQATLLGLQSVGTSANVVTNEVARLNEQLGIATQRLAFLQGLNIPARAMRMDPATRAAELAPAFERQISQRAASQNLSIEAARALLPSISTASFGPEQRTRGGAPSVAAINEAFRQAVESQTRQLAHAVPQLQQVAQLIPRAPSLTEYEQRRAALPPAPPPPAPPPPPPPPPQPRALPAGPNVGGILSDQAAEERIGRIGDRLGRIFDRLETRGSLLASGPFDFRGGQTRIVQPRFELEPRQIETFTPIEPTPVALRRATEQANREALQRSIQRAIEGKAYQGTLVGGAERNINLETVQDLAGYLGSQTGRLGQSNPQQAQRYLDALLRGRELPASILSRLPDEYLTSALGTDRRALRSAGSQVTQALPGLLTQEEMRHRLLQQQIGAFEATSPQQAIALGAGPLGTYDAALAEDRARTAERERMAQQDAARRQRQEEARRNEEADRRRREEDRRQREAAAAVLTAQAAPPPPPPAASVPAPRRPQITQGADPDRTAARLRAAGLTEAQVASAMANMGLPAPGLSAPALPRGGTVPPTIPPGALYDPQAALRALAGEPGAHYSRQHNILRRVGVSDLEERQALIRGEVPAGSQERWDAERTSLDQQRAQAQAEAARRVAQEAAQANARLLELSATINYLGRTFAFGGLRTAGDIAGTQTRALTGTRVGGPAEVALIEQHARDLTARTQAGPLALRSYPMTYGAAQAPSGASIIDVDSWYEPGARRPPMGPMGAIGPGPTGAYRGPYIPFGWAHRDQGSGDWNVGGGGRPWMGTPTQFLRQQLREMGHEDPMGVPLTPQMVAEARQRLNRMQRSRATWVGEDPYAWREQFYGPPTGGSGAGGGRGGGGGYIGGFGGGFGGDDRRGRPPGPLGSAVDEFKSGYMGPDYRTFPWQIGQTARFATLYGTMYSVLFNVSQAFSAAVTEALAFQDALVSLNVITERSSAQNQTLANSLGEAAAAAGMAPSTGVATGAQAIGLFDLAAAPYAEQSRSAQVASETALMVARITGAAPDQVNTQLASVAAAFGMGAQDVPRVADMAQYVSRYTGRSITDLLPAAANVGTLAATAGYDLPEILAAVGRISARTGLNANTAAGGLRQVLSRAYDPGFERQTSQMFGFDATGMSLNDIFTQVAATSPTEQQAQQFANLFGRGNSSSAALVLLEEAEKINQLAAGAQGVAGTGYARDEFENIMSTFTGQLRLLGAEALDLGKGLVDTGILDFLYLLVKAAREVVGVLDDLVDLFNLLPREMRSVVIILAELTAALYLLGRAAGASTAATAAAAAGAGVGAAGARRAGAGAVAVTAGGILGAAAGDAINRGGRLNVLAGAGRVGAGATAGLGALGALVGGGALAGGVLLGVGALGYGAYSEVRQGRERREAALDARRAMGGAQSAEDFRTAAALYRTSEELAQEQQRFSWGDLLTLGIGPGIANGFGMWESGVEAQDRRDRLNAERAEAEADQLDEIAARAAAANPATDIDLRNADSVRQALSALDERFFSAADRVRMLSSAFDLFVAQTERVPGAIGYIAEGQGELFAGSAQAAAAGALSETESMLRGRGERSRRPFGYGLFISPSEERARALESDYAEAADLLSEGMGYMPSGEKIRSGVLGVLRQRGKDTSAGAISLDDGDRKAIDAFLNEQVEFALAPLRESGLEGEVLEAAEESIRKNLATQLAAAIGDFQSLELTPENLGGFMRGMIELAGLTGEETRIDTGSPLAGAQAQLDTINQALIEANSQIEGPDFAGLPQAEQDEILAMRQWALRQRRVVRDQQASLSAESNIADIEFRASALTPDDTVARRSADIAVLREQRGATRDPVEQTRIDAQIATQTQQLALDRFNAETASNLAGFDPRDQASRLAEQISRAQQLLEDGFTQGTEGYAALQEQIKRWQIEQEDLSLRSQDLADRVGVAAGDRVGQAQAAARNTARRLEYARGTGQQYLIDEARIADEAARYQSAQIGASVGGAVSLAGIDPRNTFARLRQQRANLIEERRIAQLFNDTGGAAQATEQINANEIERANNQLRLQAAERRASRAGIESPLRQARGALTDAEANLRIQLRGTPEWAEAHAQVQELKKDISKQEAALAQMVAANARSDVTNPLQMAREQYRELQRQLNAAVARGEGQDVIEPLRNAVTEARWGERATAFDQEFNDLRFQEQVGQITQAQFVRTMQARRSAIATELAGMKESQDGYRMLQEQLQQLDLAIKAAGEGMEGMWNLGDIRVPTPYEMRRAAQASPGDGLRGFAGNASTTVSNVNVTINGADLVEVKRYLSVLLGPQQSTRTAVAPRRV